MSGEYLYNQRFAGNMIFNALVSKLALKSTYAKPRSVQKYFTIWHSRKNQTTELNSSKGSNIWSRNIEPYLKVMNKIQ